MRAAESGLDRGLAQLEYLWHGLFRRRLRTPQTSLAEGRRVEAGELRYRLRRDGFTTAALAACFARCAEAVRAPLPESALAAARRLLEGGIVECADPAVRRQALVLAALARAMRGDRVHVLGASDGAARALAESLADVCAALGIGVGCLSREMGLAARREAYASAVLCAAHRELALDHLRESARSSERRGELRSRLERLAGAAEPPLVGELPYALVDDADLVLLDDAQAPIAVTAQADQSGERLLYEQALELARSLAAERDFVSEGDAIRLTDAASRRLERLVAPLGGVWSARGRREELVGWALEALHFLEREVDYRVDNGRVLFPPPSPDAEEPGPDELEVRKLVEVKEGCPLGSRTEVLARLSVPRFFSRYAGLGGVCADAEGLEPEFWSLYGLKTAGVGARREALLPQCRVFLTGEAKRAAVVERVRQGEALVGVRSRSEAQALQAALAAAGLQVALVALPALQARSGDRAGELIVVELPLAARHIPQACAAYGARACRLLLSLEDEAFAAALGGAFVALARLAAARTGELPPRWSRWAVRRAQRALERAQRTVREELKARERLLEDLLAVSGRPE